MSAVAEKPVYTAIEILLPSELGTRIAVAAIDKIFLACFPDIDAPWAPSYHVMRPSSRDSVYLATIGGIIAGFVVSEGSLGTEKSDSYPKAPAYETISWLAVDPAYQGRGVGLCLVKRVIDRAKELGRTAVHVNYETEHKKDWIAKDLRSKERAATEDKVRTLFYERLGDRLGLAWEVKQEHIESGVVYKKIEYRI